MKPVVYVNQSEYDYIREYYSDADIYYTYVVVEPLDYEDYKENLGEFEEPAKWPVVKNIHKPPQVLNKKPTNNPIQGRNY